MSTVCATRFGCAAQQVHGSGTATSISKAGFGSLVGALADNRMREIETENDAQLRYAALISRAAVVDPPPEQPAVAADGGCAAAASIETETAAAPPEAPITEVHFSVKPMGGRKKAFVDRVVILRDTDELAAALGAFAREADCHGTPSINDLASHSPSLLWSLYAMLGDDNTDSSAGNTEKRTVLLMQRLLRDTEETAK